MQRDIYMVHSVIGKTEHTCIKLYARRPYRPMLSIRMSLITLCMKLSARRHLPGMNCDQQEFDPREW